VTDFPNYVTASDVRNAIRVWNRNPPAIVISHSCPAGLGIGMRADPRMADSVQRHCRDKGHDPGLDDDCGEPGLTDLWRGLKQRPQLWAYGHFHQLHDRTVDGCRFLNPGSGDGTDGSPLVRPVILDVSNPATPMVEIITDPARGL
jgi:hypothetical protein